MNPPRHHPSPPRLIVCLQGGLGNQMFQYAAGRALALTTGRELVLDPTRIARDPNRHYQLNTLAIQARLAKWPDRLAVRWARRFRSCPLHQPIGLTPFPWRWIDESQADATDRLSQARQTTDLPLVMRGFWQGEGYFKDHAPTIRRELQLIQAPDAANAPMLDRIGQVHAVAVHVRRGDYVSNPQFAQFHGTCSPNYYRRAFDLMCQRLDRPVFFLFSDDPDWAQANLQPPGETVIVRHNLGRSDEQDLRLMAACHSLVIANSSFSWWAAYLADRPDKIVVAPSRWCADEKLTRQLRVQSWEYLP